MRRALRRLLGRLLPEAVKRPVRGRMFGFRAPRSELRPAFAERGGDVVVTLDRMLELKAPASALGDLQYHLRDNGESVDEIAGLLRVARSPGGLLLDVGGHKGVLACLFCLAAPGNRAVSYEPSPRLRSEAERIRAMNGLEARLELNGAAVGDRSFETTGYVDASGVAGFGEPPPGTERIPVSFTTLDAECERLGRWPDVVKIDIEGFEDLALAGAARLIAEHPPILLLELHLDLLEGRGVPVRGLLDDLRRSGYEYRSPTGRALSAGAIAASPAAVRRVIGMPAPRRMA